MKSRFFICLFLLFSVTTYFSFGHLTGQERVEANDFLEVEYEESDYQETDLLSGTYNQREYVIKFCSHQSFNYQSPLVLVPLRPPRNIA